MDLAGNPPVPRAATLDDIPALGDLLESVGAEGLWIATEPPLDRRRFGFNIRSFIERQSHLCLVVPGENGSLLGELTAWPDGPRSAMLGVCVARDARHGGIGSALLGGCIAWARERELRRLTLKVFPHNHVARALYTKFGFVEEGIERGAIRRRNGERWDAVAMSLDLTAAIEAP